MVDIFEIAPPEAARPAIVTPYDDAGRGNGRVRYQHLLTKLSGPGDAAHATVDWLPADDEAVEAELGSPSIIKVEGDEPLVGNFADAAAAMA